MTSDDTHASRWCGGPLHCQLCWDAQTLIVSTVQAHTPFEVSEE